METGRRSVNPLRFPVAAPESLIGVMYLYALLAYPEQDKEKDKNRLLFAPQSW